MPKQSFLIGNKQNISLEFLLKYYRTEVEDNGKYLDRYDVSNLMMLTLLRSPDPNGDIDWWAKRLVEMKRLFGNQEEIKFNACMKVIQ